MTLLHAIRRRVNAAADPLVRMLLDCYRRSSGVFAAHRRIGDAAQGVRVRFSIKDGVQNVRDGVQSEDGSALIEFAASLSLMMTFVCVLMQISIALYTYGTISECAREATRWASVRGSSCLTSGGASCTATTSSVSSYAAGLGFPNIGGGTVSAVTSYPDSNEAPGSRVKVVITYSLATSLPLVPKKTIPLQVSSEMYIVQ